MSRETVTGIQPEIFRWARTSVGLEVNEVAQMLKRQPKEIEAWERGDAAPTYAQLEKLAYQIYKRPLAVFFLPEPPQERMPQKEFRTLPDADIQTLSRDTYLHIRKAHAYQLALKELFDDRNPAKQLIWKDVQLALPSDIPAQAKEIREYLGVNLQQQASWKDDDQALKAWRKSIEDMGIFVFKAAFKQKEISGFCLIDDQFPLIYLNNSTTKTRQIFSMMHELAHLLAHVNGLSKFDPKYIKQLAKQEKDLEIFCNAMAAEILIPSSDFERQSQNSPEDIERASDQFFANLAGRYGVSREAILRRFLDQGRISQYFYEQKAKYWTQQKKQAGGGNWYLNQGAYLSDRFSKEVVARHYRQQISLEQAANFLGIKPKSYAGFEERVLQGADA